MGASTGLPCAQLAEDRPSHAGGESARKTSSATSRRPRGRAKVQVARFRAVFLLFLERNASFQRNRFAFSAETTIAFGGRSIRSTVGRLRFSPNGTRSRLFTALGIFDDRLTERRAMASGDSHLREAFDLIVAELRSRKSRRVSKYCSCQA